MKSLRFSPWLIFVLAAALVFVAGCERPYPQEPLATPAPMNVPTQLPLQPEAIGTQLPQGEATPTLPAVVVTELGVQTPAPGQPTPVQPVSGQPQAQPSPQVQPTVPPAGVQSTPQSQPPTASSQTQAQTAGGVYTVKAGDTLFSIGRMYNVNPYSIAAANNIPYPYIIYPGQQLVIPTGTPPSNPTPIPPQPGACRYYHTVRPGENLFRISMAYGVPMDAIAAANGISNYNLIYAGQVLCIP